MLNWQIIFQHTGSGLLYSMLACTVKTHQSARRIFLKITEAKTTEERKSQKHPTKQELEQNSPQEILRKDGFILMIKKTEQVRVKQGERARKVRVSIKAGFDEVLKENILFFP